MKWHKKGKIFDPRDYEWAGSHAQVPTAIVFADRIRIYYADRTSENKSFPSFIDVEKDDPTKIISYHKIAVQEHGASGEFDADGIMPGHVMEHNGQIWMYYTGWKVGGEYPYQNTTGLSISEDYGLNFKRYGDDPVIGISQNDPFMCVTPTILKEGEDWHMWYTSTLKWEMVNGQYESIYSSRHASSKDGMSWDRDDSICLKQNHDLEAISNPSVVNINNTYYMWYSTRHSENFRDGQGSYFIGGAFSNDGNSWVRDDEKFGLQKSADGWDSTMICYPNVVNVDGRYLMFYNGNSFGQTGIGYAELEI